MNAMMPLIPMQRSKGDAFVRFGASSQLVDLAQSGSAKAFVPPAGRGGADVIFLNTAGGLTDQDQLRYGVDVGAGAHITATTQTAERAYASRGLAAVAEVAASIGAGGRLDWLPQETVLFEDSHLTRNTTFDLAAGATCLLAESIILGRHAMGERPVAARLTDHRLVRQGGRVVWADTVRIDRSWLAQMTTPALMGPARAFAVVALIGAGAEDAVGPVRAVLTEADTTAAATAFGGKCIVRIAAPDGWPLRRQMMRVLGVLRGGLALPRVWQMQGAVA